LFESVWIQKCKILETKQKTKRKGNRTKKREEEKELDRGSPIWPNSSGPLSVTEPVPPFFFPLSL
jgi:hypothetical protein